MTFSQIYSNIKFAAEPAGKTGYAVVAQSVERFLGKEEVRQFKSAQQLQQKRTVEDNTVLFYFHKISKKFRRRRIFSYLSGKDKRKTVAQSTMLTA